MRWLPARRRRKAELGGPEVPSTTALVIAPRVERALVSLAVHAAQLDRRIEQLEHRLDQTIEATDDLPSHGDVLEVRVHSARVAAELARVTIELRAEIDKVATQPERVHDQRVRLLAETVLDLSDRMDTVPADYRAS
jgi:hypothetical protein